MSYNGTASLVDGVRLQRIIAREKGSEESVTISASMKNSNQPQFIILNRINRKKTCPILEYNLQYDVGIVYKIKLSNANIIQLHKISKCAI